MASRHPFKKAIADGISPFYAFRQAEGRLAHDVAVAANIDLKRLTAIENGQYPATAEAASLAKVC